MSDPLDIKQIRWKCRRGMLELDFLLERFVDVHYQTLSPEDKQLFLDLLEYTDDELYQILVKKQFPHEKILIPLIEILRAP